MRRRTRVSDAPASMWMSLAPSLMASDMIWEHNSTAVDASDGCACSAGSESLVKMQVSSGSCGGSASTLALSVDE